MLVSSPRTAELKSRQRAASTYPEDHVKVCARPPRRSRTSPPSGTHLALRMLVSHPRSWARTRQVSGHIVAGQRTLGQGYNARSIRHLNPLFHATSVPRPQLQRPTREDLCRASATAQALLLNISSRITPPGPCKRRKRHNWWRSRLLRDPTKFRKKTPRRAPNTNGA